MKRFPYITEYVNQTFADEKDRWDFIIIRPLIIFFYFFLRCILFPIKFIFHRRAWGCEGYFIDWFLAIGMKYLARHDAAELLVRHAQIEPLLYRHLLLCHPTHPQYATASKFNGIDGDYSAEKIKDVYWNNMTIGHDQLSYEIIDRFDKNIFLENINFIRSEIPGDHMQFSKAALEENKRCSFQVLGATNVVLLIVVTITIFRGPENCRNSTKLVWFRLHRPVVHEATLRRGPVGNH